VSQIACKVPNLRYFITGEYGSHTKRPHYHGIFYNIPDYENVNDLFTKNWQNGHVHIGNVTARSISYTAKYCVKDFTEESFCMMSSHPGIGVNYVNRMINYHNDLSIFYGVDHGNKVSLPRYYRDKIFNKFAIIDNRIASRIESENRQDRSYKELLSHGENPYYHKLMEKVQSEFILRNRSKQNEKL